MHVRRIVLKTSFTFKYKICTLTPFVKPCNVLNIAVWNIFYVQLYMESAFMYNPGLTPIEYWDFERKQLFFCMETKIPKIWNLHRQRRLKYKELKPWNPSFKLKLILVKTFLARAALLPCCLACARKKYFKLFLQKNPQSLERNDPRKPLFMNVVQRKR